MKIDERLLARRAPRQERSRQSVEAILEAVPRVMSRHGAKAITTNRIAEAAGVSIGSLYQYFPDKRAIFVALHRRAANAAANPSSVTDRDFAATRPFERALIDHCLLKLYCVLCRTDENLFVCRPLITVLRDAYSKRPLAWWVGFSAQRRATAMVLRSCLRRHGRLPENISVDQGSDFLSVYLSAFLAHCGVNLIVRPKSDSRFGAEIERLFGQFISFWLDARPGNLIDLTQVRAVFRRNRTRRLHMPRAPSARMVRNLLLRQQPPLATELKPLRR